MWPFKILSEKWYLSKRKCLRTSKKILLRKKYICNITVIFKTTENKFNDMYTINNSNYKGLKNMFAAFLSCILSAYFILLKFIKWDMGYSNRSVGKVLAYKYEEFYHPNLDRSRGRPALLWIEMEEKWMQENGRGGGGTGRRRGRENCSQDVR